MGRNEGIEFNAAQDRAWGKDGPTFTEIAESAHGIRSDLSAPFSEHFDSFCDAIEDECSELREVVLLLLKGEGPEAVAKMNVMATHYAYKVARGDA